MALDAGSVFAVLGGKFNPAGFAQFDAAMKKSTASATAAERAHARSAGAMTLMGTAAKTGAAVGVAALGIALVKSIQTASQFDSAMRNVNSIAGLSEAQFKGLSKAVLSLSGKTAQAPITLAEGLYDLVSSGFNAKDSLTILASSAKAASAGLTTTQVATKAVAAVLNAYKLPASQAAKVSDDLFQTVKVGVLSFDELASSIGDVLPFAQAVGVDLKGVGSAVSTLTKAGISAPEAMTRIKGALSALISPSNAMKDSFQKLGVASGEELIKKTGSLQGALQKLTGTVGNNKTEVAKLFPDIRGLSAALLLTGTNAKSANSDLAAFADTTGSTDAVLAEQRKSLAFQSKQLAANIDAIAVSVGSNLIPALAQATGSMAEFVAQMQKGEGSAGVMNDILKGLGTVINFSLGGLAMAAFGVVDLFDKIAQAGALIGIPGFEDAHQKLQKLGDDLVGMSKSLMDVNKKPVNIKLIADKKAAISAIRDIQNSKIAPKVAKILGNKKDADSKFKALIALGIPPKTAKTLTNAKDTQDAIKQLKAELASIRNPPAIVFTATEGGSQRAWNRLSPGLASGTSAGMAQTALVGEGGGPEWIVNRDTGTARKVTGPQVTNLSASEYVIPTESKYRPQALGLLGMLAADLGVSGFASGTAAKKKRDRRYAAQDRRAQGYSDRASEQGTWMDTYQQRGDSGRWGKAKASQARYLGLERDYVSNILKHPGRSKGARLQVMKSLRAQIANDIETNKAAEFSKAESATYTKEDQDKLTGFAADLAKASFTPSTDDDLLALKAQNAYLTKLYNTEIVGGQRGNQAIIDVAGDLRSVRDQIAGLTTPGDSASSRMTASRNATSEYGSNFMAATPNAGAQIRITNHYQSPPEDPHSWSNGVKYELKAAL